MLLTGIHPEPDQTNENELNRDPGHVINVKTATERKTIWSGIECNWVLWEPPVGTYICMNIEELPLNINQAAVSSITGFRSEMSDVQPCCPGHVKLIFQPCALMRETLKRPHG